VLSVAISPPRSAEQIAESHVTNARRHAPAFSIQSLLIPNPFNSVEPVRRRS
jgi:hypothetical protein